MIYYIVDHFLLFLFCFQDCHREVLLREEPAPDIRPAPIRSPGRTDRHKLRSEGLPACCRHCSAPHREVRSDRTEHSAGCRELPVLHKRYSGLRKCSGNHKAYSVHRVCSARHMGYSVPHMACPVSRRTYSALRMKRLGNHKGHSARRKEHSENHRGHSAYHKRSVRRKLYPASR